jgi:hypothetical protein
VEIIGRTFASDREGHRRANSIVNRRVNSRVSRRASRRAKLLPHHRVYHSLIHRDNPLPRSTTSFTHPGRPQIANPLLTNLGKANTDEDDLTALRETLSKPAFCQFLDMKHEQTR